MLNPPLQPAAMLTDLPALVRIVLWLALPVAVASLARSRRITAVPAMAFGMAVALVAVAGVSLYTPTVMLSRQAAGRAYHDTYYIVSRTPAFLTLAASYLFFAALAALIVRLSRPARPALPGYAFWLFHLGAPVSVFPMALLATFHPVPRRYVDYPEAFTLSNRLAGLGGLAVWLAFGLLCVALTGTLIRAWRRRS